MTARAPWSRRLRRLFDAAGDWCGRIPVITAAAAGALAPLSFSPVNLWPASLVSVFLLIALLRDRGARRAALIGWGYGLGFFGVGVSWVYVSIDVYGNAGPALAGFLTAGFVAGLAGLFALQCGLYRRFCPADFSALSFAALWVMFEWFRGWLFTGFPWLYLGYAHVNTLLSGLAPVFGVLGISFVVALSAGVLYRLWRHFLARSFSFHDMRPMLILALFLMWGIPAVLRQVDWVAPEEADPVAVGLVQADIDQELKFDRGYLEESLGLYNRLTGPLWGREIVVWPETAIPLVYQQAANVVDFFAGQAAASGSSLVTGILFRNGDRIHNSIVSLGNGSGIYHKQKLVPFGEYVPLRSVLENLLQIFELPVSSLSPGPRGQSLLNGAGLTMAPYICYEVVYPGFVRKTARGADLLVTISNDTWFGASWGPLQHLQMAAMRALENGRYMLRATNNGVSAIIDPRGQIVERSPQFQVAVLEGEVRLLEGTTPFSRWGSWPVLFTALALIVFMFARQRRARLPWRRTAPKT